MRRKGRPVTEQRRPAYQRMLKENSRMIQTAAFVLLILFLGAAGILMPDRKMSDQENRGLAGFPKPTAQSLRDGTWMDGISSYASDQFAFRDQWISLKFRISHLLGMREDAGVLIGKKKYLQGVPVTPNEEKVANTIRALQAFAAKYPNLNKNLAIVPDSAAMQPQFLPKGAHIRDQKADIQKIYQQTGSGITCLDIASYLEKYKDEALYYKTDHHWTSVGAKHAFDGMTNELGIANPIRSYRTYTVTKSFEGTLSSKVGSHRAKDEIRIYVPQTSDFEYLVEYPDQKKKAPSIFDAEALDQKDQYTVFFGGNHSLVEIKTTANTGKRLLVFKDSYANAFMQFMLPYYDSITMIDPRYYYEDASSLIQNHQITDVLFLYSADSFLEDGALADCLDILGSSS